MKYKIQKIAFESFVGPSMCATSQIQVSSIVLKVYVFNIVHSVVLVNLQVFLSFH